VLDGNNFTYGSGESGITLAGGTLTSFHEFTDTGTALADFTGLLVDAVTWLADAKLAAGGTTGPLDALTSTFAYHFNGGSGPETFGSAGHADTLSGTGIDVFDGGGAPSGSHDTLTGGAGSTFVFAQGYGALTITNFDQDSGGNFSQSIGDHIQLNGLTAKSLQHVSYSGGNAILDFGNSDVVTLLHVTEADFIGLDGSEFTSGGSGSSNNNGPILNSFTLTVSQGGTDVLTPADFSVTNPQNSDFYSVQNAVGGEFEVFNGTNWVAATTGGFHDTQIAAGEVEFVQDGTATVPDFSITVSDGTGNVSPAIAPTVNFTASDSIADGATYTISAPTGETVAFAGSTGTLDLVHPSTFTGTISNFTGTAADLSSSDAIDLVGFNAGHTTVTSAVYNSGTTAVTVTDSSGDGLFAVLNFSGNDPESMFKIGSSSDGAYVFDPPAPANMAVVPTAVLDEAASSTIVASGPNQILTGNAASDTFAFNFTGVGHTTVTDFHPATDTLQFSNQLFADLQAALNATHDDGHGNTVVALDGHDTITLNGILKAQLHASDFHFV
jgi:hypothetical protein